jgi:uncharacterized protein YjbI with pentapeptide repeats
MNTTMTHDQVLTIIAEAHRRGKAALLSGANLEGMSLPRVNLRGASLQGARFAHADLRGANLSGAMLQCADLQGAALVDADLQRANLHAANVSNADLRGADLQEAQVGNAIMINTDLRGANMRGTYLGIPGIDRVDLSTARRSRSAGLLVRLWLWVQTPRRQRQPPAFPAAKEAKV